LDKINFIWLYLVSTPAFRRAYSRRAHLCIHIFSYHSQTKNIHTKKSTQKISTPRKMDAETKSHHLSFSLILEVVCYNCLYCY
jgi:hypothetical protein